MKKSILFLILLPVCILKAQDPRHAMSSFWLTGLTASSNYVEKIQYPPKRLSAWAVTTGVYTSIFGLWGPNSDLTKRFRMADFILAETGLGLFNKKSDLSAGELYFSGKLGLGLQAFYGIHNDLDAGGRFYFGYHFDDTRPGTSLLKTISLFARYKRITADLPLAFAEIFFQTGLTLRMLLGPDKDKYVLFQLQPSGFSPENSQTVNTLQLQFGFGWNTFSPNPGRKK